MPSSPPRAGAALDGDRAAALDLVPVSRETEARFSVYVDLLRRWQGVKNLVAGSTLPRVWTRHIADSAQLQALVPDALTWADMGSGAGFPGLVIAILLRGQAGGAVHLIESNARKCAFLREAARECEAPAVVHNARAEDVLPRLNSVDVLTARAVAALPRLIELGKVQLDRGALGLFLKSEGEIGPGVPAIAGYRLSIIPSRTSEDGRIVLVRAEGGPCAIRSASPAEA